jgi:hypothetical protein
MLYGVASEGAGRITVTRSGCSVLVQSRHGSTKGKDAPGGTLSYLRWVLATS